MHHRNKNLDDTAVSRNTNDQMHKNTAALDLSEQHSSSSNYQVISTESFQSADSDRETLFNMRFPAKSSRLSKRIEADNEEDGFVVIDHAHELEKREAHVTFHEVPEIQTFEFVPEKATTFGRSESSSDFHVRDVSDTEDDNDDTSYHDDIGSFIHSDAAGDICDQIESELSSKTDQSSSSIGIKWSNSSQNGARKSPLLGKSSAQSGEATASVSAPPRAKTRKSDIKSAVFSTRQEEAHARTLQNNSLNSSSEAEAVAGVSKTSSEISESSIGSSVPSPGRSVTVVIEEEGGTPKSLKQQTSLDPAVGKDSIFTEYVNIDSFKAVQGNKNLHTEDNAGLRDESQILMLMKGDSTKALKSCLRNSLWPAESAPRQHLWENLCVHLLRAKEPMYQKLVDDMLSQDVNGVWMLPSVVDQEHLHSYFLSTPGVEQARIVVSLMTSLHPDITYCPLLYPMSCLFLHYMSPEACFSCLQALLESRTSLYIMQTKIKWEASKFVMRDLARKYAKKGHDLIVQRGGEKSVEAVFGNWMWWIFRDLPFQYLVRIIDSFLLEGYKILYRIALAIIILFAKEQSQNRSYSSHLTDIHTDISRFCKNITIDPRKLIKLSFGIRNLSRTEITSLHEKNEAHVRSLPVSVVSTQSSGLRLKEKVPSSVLSLEMLQIIWEWIPLRLSLMKPVLLFSSDEDGTAIRTLYTRTEHAPQTILIIKTTANEVFGAFCSSSWYTRHEVNKPTISFFGTGETFVFSITPVMKKYAWTGLLADPPGQTADLFMAGDDHMLTIGSGNGQAIYLDAMMNRCGTSHCDTFNNKPLCSTADFSCRVVEVFGFEE